LLVIPVSSKNSLADIYDKAKEIHTEKYTYDTTTREEESGNDKTPIHSQSYVISKFNGISTVQIGSIVYSKYDSNNTVGAKESIHAIINCDIERNTGKDCLDNTDMLGNGIMFSFLEAYDANKSEIYHQKIMKCIHDQTCNNEVEDGNLIFHVFRKPIKITENNIEWSDIIDDISITIIK
ncbi:MAG: hypothetical protein CJD30_05605, partial [Sulfuricurvum sp. PD_MW2]|uniref:hypothetical protein n=1 Tax=Sulfuricurvum sp. PD_MW2 TaxID=2027917 RepID=UPI000C067A33